MEREVESLKKEILVLKERVKVLESKEHHRSIKKSLKTLVNIVLIGAAIFAIWRAYDYVTNYIPNYLDEKVSELNPFNKGDVPSNY